MKGSPGSVAEAVAGLRRGELIAYPTEGVWGLGCDPAREDAVQRILQLKGRDVSKGLILVAASLAQLGPLLEGLAPQQRQMLAENCPGPTTWLLPDPDQVIPPWIRGNFATVAVRVSQHPLVRDLCEGFGGMLVSTSANPAGAAPALSSRQVQDYFGAAVDVIVPGELGGQSGPSKIVDLLSGEVFRPGATGA